MSIVDVQVVGMNRYDSLLRLSLFIQAPWMGKLEHGMAALVNAFDH
jgi:hypothetical protein